MTTTTILSDESHMLLVCSTIGAGEMSTIKAGVFGQLVRRADGIVKHFRGDLFHDAQWLEENLTLESLDGFKFVFGVRGSGTMIGFPDFEEALLLYSEQVWTCQIENERLGRWEIRLRRIK